MSLNKSKLHIGIILLHGWAGFFILTFFLSLFVYIYLQHLLDQQFEPRSFDWIRMLLLPFAGLCLGAICSYAIISIKKLPLKYTFISSGLAFFIYYLDFYFGSFLHRKYTNILYAVFDEPSMNAILIGYILLVFSLGILLYYFSYKMNIKGPDERIFHESDVLDEEYINP